MSTTLRAAEVGLIWEHIEFGDYNSDMSQSGYKVYLKNVSGDYIQVNGDVLPTVNTFTHLNAPFGNVCYVLTAFNQYGESGYSEEACAVIGIPPAPDGASILITINIVVNP